MPIAFVNGQLERRMVFWVGRHVAVFCMTAVTNDNVLDPEVKQAIKGGRTKQDGPGEDFIVPPISERGSDQGSDENRHAQPVGEVFLAIQFSVAADGTGRQVRTNGSGWQGHEMITGRAMPFGRIRRDASAGLADRATKTEFHTG